MALLARLLPLLRCAFPRARFLVRLDGGFASPALFDFLGAQPRLDYVVAMASNAVLLRHAEPAMLVARARSERSEQTEHLYMDTRYAAGTWSDARRVTPRPWRRRGPGATMLTGSREATALRGGTAADRRQPRLKLYNCSTASRLAVRPASGPRRPGRPCGPGARCGSLAGCTLTRGAFPAAARTPSSGQRRHGCGPAAVPCRETREANRANHPFISLCARFFTFR